MNYVVVASFVLNVTALNAPAASPAHCTPDAGLCRVQTLLFDWHDDARDRDVPAKVHYPADTKGPCPVIVVSHGLGGSRDGYEFLGSHWASHGYVSVHVQHKGSDTDVWKGAKQPMEAMQRAAANPIHALNRPKDVTFALDQLEKLNIDPTSPLKGRLDFNRVGVAGHSFGAHTALVVSGRKLGGPRTRYERRDLRVRACLAMSAPSKAAEIDCPSYNSFSVPCFHMTGTKDDSPIGRTTVEHCRVPFDCINGPDQYLVIFQDGDHMIFSGRRRRGGNDSNDPLFHELIRASSTAFWDAYLRDQSAAKTWLSGGGFKTALGPSGTFEARP